MTTQQITPFTCVKGCGSWGCTQYDPHTCEAKKREPSMTLTQLVARGFDASSSDGDGYVSVICSRCAAVVINGTPCHEHGCPNLMHECDDCNAMVPARQRYCEECA